MENLWFPVGFPLKSIDFSRKRGEKTSDTSNCLDCRHSWDLKPHLQVLDVGKHHNTDKKKGTLKTDTNSVNNNIY